MLLPDAPRTQPKKEAERCAPHELPNYSCKSSLLVERPEQETFGECKEKMYTKGRTHVESIVRSCGLRGENLVGTGWNDRNGLFLN